MLEEDKFARIYREIVQSQKLSSEKAKEILQEVLKALGKLKQS